MVWAQEHVVEVDGLVEPGVAACPHARAEVHGLGLAAIAINIHSHYSQGGIDIDLKLNFLINR